VDAAPTIAWAPSPNALRRTTQKKGTRSFAVAMNSRAECRIVAASASTSITVRTP
jgi:hypothetical protein